MTTDEVLRRTRSADARRDWPAAYQVAGDDTAAAELDEAARTFARLGAASPGRVAQPRPRAAPEA